MNKKLSGKTAVVSGASSGNGRAIALALAEEGAAVVCADLQREARSEGYEPNLAVPTDEVIRSKGGRAEFVMVDVSDPRLVEELVAFTTRTFGRIDIMVNNAGYFSGLHTIIDETVEQYDRTMAVNAKGVWLGCKYAITAMAAQEPAEDGVRGRVVNIASLGGLKALPAEPAYCASKGAVVNLTRQLAQDFGPQSIAVNAICPGLIETAMVRQWLDNPDLAAAYDNSYPWPMRGQASDVAKAVVYLSCSDSSYVHGALLTVDGGAAGI